MPVFEHRPGGQIHDVRGSSRRPAHDPRGCPFVHIQVSLKDLDVVQGATLANDSRSYPD